MRTLLLILLFLVPTIVSRMSRLRSAAAQDEADGASGNDYDFEAEEQPAAPAPEPALYFTYETVEPEVGRSPFVAPQPVQRPAPAARQQREQAAPAVAEQPRAFDFDLRKAVIYQAIMNNNYINQTNQSIQ